MLLTESLFTELVSYASMAPSSDNMQPWAFRRHHDAVEVYCVKSRLLRIDVGDMFSWLSIGAAIQNLVTAASAHGLLGSVDFSSSLSLDEPVARVLFDQGPAVGNLAEWIPARTTNRSAFQTTPLGPVLKKKLSDAVCNTGADIRWITTAPELACMVSMDADFSAILLEHKPLFDGLFDTIRFSRKEIAATQCGMDVRSLAIPKGGLFIARHLKRLEINRIISRLGIGRRVAKRLSSRLGEAGALCLLTARERSPVGYMKAGRAMEQLWNAATAEGLSAHPYGVIPQYFAAAELKPEMFLPQHVDVIESHRESFLSLFSVSEKEYPAVMLRLGWADKHTPRNDFRLALEQILKD